MTEGRDAPIFTEVLKASESHFVLCNQRRGRHSEEGALYAANTGIKHTEEYGLCSESGHVIKQRSKYFLCSPKENMIDSYCCK